MSYPMIALPAMLMMMMMMMMAVLYYLARAARQLAGLKPTDMLNQT